MSDISIFKRYSKSQFPSPGLRSRLWSRGAFLGCFLPVSAYFVKHSLSWSCVMIVIEAVQ
ncbi:hypothetical protein RAC83_002124 [Xylella fastidiosa]|nr:hypothetical protein [Xylella fastidiosa]